MKTNSLYFVTAVGILFWGCYRNTAQPLLISAPSVVQVAQVDHRYGVMHPDERVISEEKGLPYKGKVGLSFKGAHQSEVEALVRYGVLSHCLVYVMNGTNLVATSYMVGEAITQFQTGDGATTEYGYFLSFSSEQEAERVALIMRREPPMSKQELEGLIRSHRHDLDDQRFWITQ